MKGLILFASLSYALVVSPRDVPVTARETSSTPTVDLGYEIHQGTINETGSYYSFSNIPYAEQPIGQYRFQKPVALNGSSSDVNDGSTTGVQCMQAAPKWILEIEAAAYGVDVDTMAAIFYAQAGQTESCLLLDVHVPTEVFGNSSAEAPVLFWIHGGGFTTGSKTSAGDAAGLIARSQLDGSSGVILVTINYRLGLFGWLAGGSATANLGLFDQRMALEWVQNYISLFGGSPDKVTVMGESAGAASIMHHITSYGGAESVPFQRAIPQSPAFDFSIDYETSMELTLTESATYISSIIDSVVADVNSTVTDQVSSISASFDNLLVVLDFLGESVSDVLKYINQAVVVQADTGRFNYGVVVDGDYVPALPQVLLSEGKFVSSIDVMASHTSNESVPFTPTTIATSDDVREYMVSALKTASNETIDYMLSDVYPAVFDGTYPWYSEFGRVVQMNTDLNFACSTNFIANAFFSADSYNYIFAYPPGYHAEDVSYVFFNGDTSTLDDGLAVNATLAYTLQDYIVQFAKTGNPNSDSLPTFPVYGTDGNVISFTAAGPVVQIDDMKNDRCDWIQQAMVDGLL